MRYLVLVYDGMADRPLPALNGKTPMETAKKPFLDGFAKDALVGTVSNVPEGMVPESDTANLAILSYDPKVYSKGRSPLEAMSMGLTMKENDVAYRANVVTLSEEEGSYWNRTMLDHSADEITTAEADTLIKAVDEVLGDQFKRFFTGVSYRHCLLWDGGDATVSFMRPHDILGQSISAYAPSGKNAKAFADMMEKSYEILNHHPINEARRQKGLRPANSLWFWSPGKKPALPSFEEKWHLKGTVISAVDLIKGIGICANMNTVDVEGATGNVHTNYEGKAQAAIDAYKNGADLVFVHVEAPDECGHRAEIENKVLSIEYIDSRILKPVTDYLAQSGEAYALMALPDHPTPIEIRTHSMEPVPFLIWRSDKKESGVSTFTEQTATAQSNYISDGTKLMSILVQKAGI